MTDDQRADIDASILASDILGAIRRIMVVCGVGLQDAREINRARYQHLRAERAAEFACSDEEYWSCYGECSFEAMAKRW